MDVEGTGDSFSDAIEGIRRDVAKAKVDAGSMSEIGEEEHQKSDTIFRVRCTSKESGSREVAHILVGEHGIVVISGVRLDEAIWSMQEDVVVESHRLDCAGAPFCVLHWLLHLRV